MSKSNGVKMLVIDNNQGQKKKQREVSVKILKALLADEMLLHTKLLNKLLRLIWLVLCKHNS